MISGINSSSAASLSEMRQALFNKIDTSGDGAIDKSEVAALLEQNTSSLVESLFGSMDSDQDGLISQIESDSGLAKLGQEIKNGGGMSGLSGAPPPPPEKVFDTADVNEDGSVTQEELEAVIGDKGGRVEELFAQIDADGDGAISRAEDEAFLQQMSERAPLTREAASNTNASSDIGRNRQMELLGAMLKGIASSTSAGEATSLYA